MSDESFSPEIICTLSKDEIIECGKNIFEKRKNSEHISGSKKSKPNDEPEICFEKKVSYRVVLYKVIETFGDTGEGDQDREILSSKIKIKKY